MRLRLARPRLSNRWRITGWMLVVVLVIVGVAGTTSVMLVKHRFLANTDDDLRSEVNAAVTVFDTFGSEILSQIAEVAPDTLGRSRYAVLVIGPDGVEHSMPATRESVLPLPDIERSFTELRAAAGEPFTAHAMQGDRDYRLITGQLADGDVLVVAAPLDDLQQAIKVIVGALLLVAIVAAVVLAVVIALVTARITKPLDAMIATAQSIGSGELDTRVAGSDVDDVDRLAGALNAMLERLELAFAERDRSEATLRRFVADASHELRTPLAAIIGYVDLYRATGHDAELTERAIGRIGSEADRMRQLVEELLMLARLDQTRPADRRPVDVTEMAADAVADAEAIDPSRTIELRTHGDGTAARVLGDRTSLRQAVDNLLANTREHTPSGTHVDVAVVASNGSVTLTVADDGPGVAPADQPHVFERFYRADRSRARPGGAGLGLAIVTSIAEHHGGSVTLTSEPGVRTAFTLTLPRAESAAQPGGAPSAASAEFL